jgi:hypothetical protein
VFGQRPQGGSRGEAGTNAAVRALVPRPSRWRIIAAALVVGVSLAACSSSTTPSGHASPSAPAAAASPTPSPASAVCRSAADLRDSVTALAHIPIGKGTVDAVRANLADVQAKLTALTSELHDSYKGQTSAVQSSLDSLKTAVSNLSASPSTSTVKGVTSAVAGVTAAVGNLGSALAPHCGSASASPSS